MQMWIILDSIRTVLFKPVFLQDQAILLKSAPNSIVGIVMYSMSMKDFTLPRRDLEIKLYKCGLLAVILIRTVTLQARFLQAQDILLKSAPSKL